jgi:NADH:ubiquinone oxidoreductase subunit 6 (subunit J)
MYIIKLLMWLSVYFIFYILFSLNTLISIFCFIIVIFFISILLLQFHIEYLTFLILLLYLGGILIFFLFTALMLNNEYTTIKNSKSYSIENISLILFASKSYFSINSLNYYICVQKSNFFMYFFPTYIGNNYFWKDLFNNQSDVSNFICLFTEKYLFLFILGNILLFTMMGVIVITKK